MNAEPIIHAATTASVLLHASQLTTPQGVVALRYVGCGVGMLGRVFALVAVAAVVPGTAWGWGATGHEWATGIAIEKLLDDVPAFVRDPAVLPELALMGREPDRSKGAGETHDKERDPGHYIDLTDDGKVMGVLGRQRHSAGWISDGQRAGHRDRQGQGDARADGGGLTPWRGTLMSG